MMSAPKPSFTVNVLTHLRDERFRPQAWAHMLADSWRQACITARSRPLLVRDWQILSVGLMSLTTVALGLQWRAARQSVRYAAPLLVAINTSQLADIYVHLGLTRPPESAIHFRRMGLPTAFTAMRGWLASWLWTRLMTKTPPSNELLLGVMAPIILSDILDGALARRMGHVTQLGRYLDAKADIFVWSALTLALVRVGILPRWFAAVFSARWFMPITLGFVRTFADADPVALNNQRFNQAAGGVHAALTGAALMAELRGSFPDHTLWRRLRDGLLCLTSFLFLGAMVRQVTRLLYEPKGEGLFS